MNKIVKIIHEVCSLWDGMPTKNYGEKYLLTWKLPSIEQAVDKEAAEEREKKLAVARQKAIDDGMDPEDAANLIVDEKDVMPFDLN